MFRLSEDLRYYLYTGKVNLRRGCMSLCELIRTEMKSDPRDSPASMSCMRNGRNRGSSASPYTTPDPGNTKFPIRISFA